MKNRLPKASTVVVDESKITQYLLSPSHPIGRTKAAFFHEHGFRAATWQNLREALILHARTARLISESETEFGIKYILEGELTTPNGSLPLLRSIWFIGKAEAGLRLVTAYPLREKSNDQGV